LRFHHNLTRACDEDVVGFVFGAAGATQRAVLWRRTNAAVAALPSP
jgi:hypothetical protein